MNVTPLWVPIVVAVVGVVGTAAAGVGGVLLTQRHADRREHAAWERERERERERWAREDEMRTFEHRRTAYASFYETLKDMALRAYDHGYGLSDEVELPEGWQSPTFRNLQLVSLYATPSVLDAASSAYNAAWRWGHEATYDAPEDPTFGDLQEAYDEAEAGVLDAIRIDLAVPGGNWSSCRD